jgi:hypothetical protein
MAMVTVQMECRLCDHWKPFRTSDGVLVGRCAAIEFVRGRTASERSAWSDALNNVNPVITKPDHYCSMFRNDEGRR